MIKKSYAAAAILAGTLFAAIALQSCSSSASHSADSDSIAEYSEEYHADNDIAMNLRSIIDAINVEEPLDSADYNFKGILTDGSGRPLYTDVQGTPGQWEIKVLSDKSAVIQNLYLGDLLADDLVQYILNSLAITDHPILQEDRYSIYLTGKTELIIEQHTAIAPNGAEGPLLKISIRKQELQ